MRENHSPLIDSQKIRFKAALNHFKSMVLQDDHVANNPQTNALLHEDMKGLIADRTWQSWFAPQPPVPHFSRIRRLDQYVAQIKKCGDVKRAKSICPEFRDGYFCELVHGGLMSQLLAPTEASEPIHTLMRRAQEYQPMSPLHLHFDAIDVAGWHQDFGGLPWSVVVAIASDRVLQLLDDRWSPRSGEVYAGFSSDFSLKWAKDDELKREEIRRSVANVKPNLFEHWMKRRPSPDWRLLGVTPDIPHEHIYKLLFALAADPDFLVEDRLSAWSLDLASSALAMHAFAWTDRYNTMALGMPPEMIYWAAFHEILFNPDISEIDYQSIACVIENWPAAWSQASATVLVNARNTYVALLDDLGLKPRDACAGLLKTRVERPLIFN
jgi:hypothetical protein